MYYIFFNVIKSVSTLLHLPLTCVFLTDWSKSRGTTLQVVTQTGMKYIKIYIYYIISIFSEQCQR